jgi:hypothetical protein
MLFFERKCGTTLNYTAEYATAENFLYTAFTCKTRSFIKVKSHHEDDKIITNYGFGGTWKVVAEAYFKVLF